MKTKILLLFLLFLSVCFNIKQTYDFLNLKNEYTMVLGERDSIKQELKYNTTTINNLEARIKELLSYK